MRREGLPGKSFVELRVLRQGLERSGVQRADIDLADHPDPFQVVQRRQKQIEGDHSSAHNRYVKAYRWFGHGRIPFWINNAGE